MSHMPRDIAATTATWADLAAELDRWGEAGQSAMLWWRDDDAVAATPQLDALLGLAGEVPLALAVIPALARPELADALHGNAQVGVFQHGWQHANHAESGKKSEYPDGRPEALVGAEIAAGRARLKALFGPRAAPVFVPPWNRFAGWFLPLLAGCGIAAISGMASRQAVSLPPGLAARDVHVDLVAWRHGRGFVGESEALGALVGQLRARRAGSAAGSRPLGILTHHLIMDRAAASFLERLIAVTATHGAVRWAACGASLS